ncbi:CD99 antigen-like isoform 2-T2 [Vipera latastei]
MDKLALSLSLVFLLLATLCRAPTKKPNTVTKKPSDYFNLEDAVDGDDDSKKTTAPPPQPKPGSHGNSGGFEDSDLLDGNLPPDNRQSDSPGMLAGIISSVVVAIAGALSSFIAYQKKKLCFKPSDQENIPVESQQGAHAAPSVQHTLLQRQ